MSGEYTPKLFQELMRIGEGGKVVKVYAVTATSPNGHEFSLEFPVSSYSTDTARQALADRAREIDSLMRN